MLVFSRRKNEAIAIGPNILLTVVEIRGDKVRLGIVSPGEMPVHRQEVFDAIHGRTPPVQPRPESPEERPFRQAILEDPDDDGLRLIFADWLEERGDPLGEFIRAQCEVARLPVGDPRHSRLRERARSLWAAHGESWKAALPAVLRSAVFELFERGFLESAVLSVDEFLGHAEAIFAAAPVRNLRLWHSWSHIPLGTQVASLAASPYLSRLSILDLTKLGLGDEGAMRLAASPYTASLRVLGLRGNRIGDAGAQALAASPHLANLTTLDLTENPLGPDGRQWLQDQFGERVRL
jgi:carbon storage regulator CsrA